MGTAGPVQRLSQAGNVTLANAVGTGIADDKAVYSYMPEIVKFYLGEEPILKNVPTWRCREPKDLAYVLDNLERAGGEGSARLRRLRDADRSLLVFHAGRARRFRRQAQGRPRETASPNPRSSSRPAPTYVDGTESRPAMSICARSSCMARSDRVVPGGLTRVALRKGSQLVVNSSQGGGSKDTWVLAE